MKKFVLAALFSVALLLSTAAVHADEERYVVILNEAPIISLASEDSGVINHVNRIYVVDSLMSAYALAPAENIKAIFSDETAYLLDTETPNDTYYSSQWHLPYVKVQRSWKNSFTGSGVKIGIVDSGMDLYHPDLPKPVYSYNVLAGADSSNVNDTFGHGSAVTGVIAAITNNESFVSGMVPAADIVSIRVAAKKEFYTSDLLLGFEKALNYGCDVINMSFAFLKSNAPSTYTQMEGLVDDAVADGVIIVAAAGNSGTTVYNYPASYDNVISVGSVGADSTSHLPEEAQYDRIKVSSSYIYADAPSTFTQHNDKITCAAPGFKIRTTYIPQTTTTISGTSFAAPIVTSAAAIAKQIKPDINTAEFITALKATCEDIYTEGYDTYTGYGLINIDKLVAYLTGTEPEYESTPQPTSSPTPSPVPTSAPTDPPVQENCIIDYGYLRMIQTGYSALETDAKVTAAIYKDNRIVSINSVLVNAGSVGTKIYSSYIGDIDYVRVYIWDSEMKPVNDVIVIEK